MGVALLLLLGGVLLLGWIFLSSRRVLPGLPASASVPSLSSTPSSSALPTASPAKKSSSEIPAITGGLPNDAVIVAGAHGRILQLNEAARSLFKITDGQQTDLETLGAKAQPLDHFLSLFSAEAQTTFQLDGRWMEAASRNRTLTTGTGRIITLREVSASAADGETLDLAKAMRVVAEIGDGVNAGLAVEPTIGTLVALVRRNLPNADAVEITIWDEARKTLAQRGWEGESAYVLALAEHGSVYRTNEGISGWIARRREPVLVRDSGANDALKPRLPNFYRSFVGTPLIIGERFIGTLEAGATAANVFTGGDLALLVAISKPVANAIINAELYSQQQHQIEDLSSLGDIAYKPNDSESVRAAYGTITARVAALLDAEMSGILLYDERTRTLSAQVPYFGLPVPIVESMRAILVEDGEAARVFANTDAWTSNDLADEPLIEQFGMGLLVSAAGVRNTALLPLQVGNRRVGLLQVNNKRSDDGFDNRDVQNLKLLAAQVSVIVEDIRLAQAERVRESEMLGLQEITQAFGAFGREEAFFTSATERIARLMNVEMCGLLLYNRASNALVAQQPFYGLEEAQGRAYQLALTPGSAMEQIWLNDDTWFTNNAPLDKVLLGAGIGDVVVDAGIDKLLMATLSAGGERLGALQVADKLDGSDFTDRDARLLLLLSAQLAAMLENTRLYDEAQRRADEADGLRQVAELAGAISTSDDSFEPTLRVAAELLDSPGVFINSLDPATGNLITYPRYVYGVAVPEPIVQTTYSPGFEHSVAISRQPFLSNDVLHDRRVLPGYRQIAEAMNIRSAVMVPLMVGDQTLGEMGVMNKRRGTFNEDDTRTLAAIALQVAAALDRIRIYQTAGQNLSRRLLELDAISRVSNELAQTVDLDRVLDVIRLEAVRALEADGNSVALIKWKDANEPILERRLGEPLSAEGLADVERAAIALDGRTLHVANYAARTDLQPMPREAHSAIAAAFQFEGRVVGVFHLYHHDVNHFDEGAAAFLETLAAKASLSYGNSLRFIENQDRSNRLRRRVEQLNQIFELGQMLQHNVDAVTMLEAIAYSVQTSCGYDNIVMTLLDQNSGMIHRVTQAGIPLSAFETSRGSAMRADKLASLFENMTYRISESLFLPIEQTVKWYVEGLETFSAQYSGQRTLAPRGRDDWHDGDMLLVPISAAGGGLLGVMSLDRPQDGKRPDRAAIEVLEIFAHQAASTIENNRLYLVTLRGQEQEARLNEVMEALTSTLKLDEIVQGVAQGALRLMPFSRMTLAWMTSDGQAFDMVRVTVQRDGQTLTIEPDQRPSLMGTAMGKTYEEARDALYKYDPRTTQPFTDLMEWQGKGERTSLIVPLVAGGLSLGALHIGSDLIDAYGFEEYRPLVRRFGNLAAVALQNARLYDEATTRTQRLSLLNRVSIALSQSLDVENILEVSLREIAGVFGIETAKAYLFEREAGVIRSIVEQPRGDFPPSDVFEADKTPTLKPIWRQATTIVVENTAQLDEGELKTALLERGITAYLVVPMSIGGQTTGAFELSVSGGERIFDQEQIELSAIIANQAAIAVLNANLLEQTLVRTRELETLLEAAQATSYSLDLNDVFSSVVRLTLQALDVDDCAIMLYDNVEEVLTVQLSINRNEDEGRIPAGAVIDLFLFPARTRALRENQIVVVRRDDPQADKRELDDMRGTEDTARLLVPLIVRDQAIGLMQVDMQSNLRTFTHRDIRMAQALGAQAATAIENARLSTETSAQVEQSLILNEMSNAISSTMDVGDMVRVVHDRVPQLTTATEVYLALYNNEKQEIVFPMAVREGREDIAIPPRPFGQDEVSYIIRNRRPLTLGGENPSMDDVRRNLRIENHEGNATRYLGVPLLAGDQVIGVLAIRDQVSTRPFGLNDQRILTSIATQLGATIQNANLFERVRNFADELNQRVEERTVELQQERDRLDALYRITAELGRTLEMEDVLDRALEMTAQAIGADEAVVLLLDPLTERLVPRAALSERARGRADGAVLDHPGAMVGEWLLHENAERAIAIPDLEAQPYWRAEMDGAAAWHSALAALLETNEDVQGVMVFLSHQPNAFDEPQVRLVSTAASQVSSAINNVDLYNLIRDQAERMTTLLYAEQEEAEKNSAILEGIGDGVLLADRDGVIILFNAAAERILRVPRAAAIGRTLPQIAGVTQRLGGTPEWVRQLQTWIARDDRAAYEELQIDRLSIGQTIANLRASSVYNSGQFLGTVSVFRDVTRDVEVDRMKSEFIANVSHELRTPMTSIKGYADLLLMGGAGEVNESQGRFLETIKTNTDRLAELVNDLLDISRIDAGTETLDIEPVSVAQVVNEAVTDLHSKPNWDKKGTHIAIHMSPDLVPLRADHVKLRQIIGNIVDNAFNYTYPGGNIDIDAHLEESASGESILISVKDDGIGIPETFRERVWNRFERYDQHALVLEVAGTGLGLSIVKHLVELHGGKVWFDSEENVGTTFYVSLPVRGPGGAAIPSSRRASEVAVSEPPQVVK